MMKKLLIAALAALISTCAVAQQIDSGTLMGNSRATQGPPRQETITALFDRAFGAVNGTVLCRTGGVWNDCTTPVLGIPGTSLGTLGFAGNTSGTVTVRAQAAAGTPTITWPNASGTPAVTATSPIVLNATTGDLTCPTCFVTGAAAALTRVDDTNVTLTLGGSPATALVNAASITVGWTGTLGLTRGGCGRALTASAGGILWSDADSCEILAGTATANQMLMSGASASPAWSTATWPATAAQGTIINASSANVLAATATPTLGVAGSVLGSLTMAGNTSGTVLIRPAAAAGSWTLTLPPNDGASGEVLQTDGSGTTTWAAVAGTGDVTAAANFGTDNSLIRADGVAKGVQSSAICVADTTGRLDACSGTDGAPIKGSSAAFSPAAGSVGEYVSSTVLAGSAVAATSVTPGNVTSISLTAGNWMVCGNVATQPAGASVVTQNIAWISTTSATLPTRPNNGMMHELDFSTSAGASYVLPVGCGRLSLGATTTVYLSFRITWTTSTMSMYGHIWATRLP